MAANWALGMAGSHLSPRPSTCPQAGRAAPSGGAWGWREQLHPAEWPRASGVAPSRPGLPPPCMRPGTPPGTQHGLPSLPARVPAAHSSLAHCWGLAVWHRLAHCPHSGTLSVCTLRRDGGGREGREGVTGGNGRAPWSQSWERKGWRIGQHAGPGFRQLLSICLKTSLSKPWGKSNQDWR